MADKIFDVVQVQAPNRNTFDLTHDYKTSMNMGNLIPVCIMECLPGDRHTLGAEALVRFAPLVAPVMQRFDARIEYFFVPNRLLWDKWNEFIASDPGDTGSIPAFPFLEIGATDYYANPKLYDYMGIPEPNPGAPLNAKERVSALPFAAYQLIYDQYYRDQNLIPSVWQKLNNGDNTVTNGSWLTALRNRAWEHDYFTSCLPFAQKGNPVTIGTTNYNDVSVSAQYPGNGSPTFRSPLGDSPVGSLAQADVSGDRRLQVGGNVGPYYYDPNGTLIADTSTLDALSVTINDLREAEALQKWLELNARGGTRINEVIKNHFNVNSSDARLQRPEYIVGVKQPVSVSEVLNTTGTVDAPQGNMAGHGVSMIDDKNYGSFFCEEHGFIIGLMSVMPKTSYQQGLQKFWLKTTDATQYYWPAFSHIGEQPVLNKEIYAWRGAAGENTFGYLPAYQDYRYVSNMVTGQFRNSLSYWTCGRIFDNAPSLNGTFITAEPRKDIFAVTDPQADCLYVHVLNKVFSSRLVPTYGTPAL